jgi:hypothetical protein
MLLDLEWELPKMTDLLMHSVLHSQQSQELLMALELRCSLPLGSPMNLAAHLCGQLA